MRALKWIIIGVFGLVAVVAVVGVILLSTLDVEDYRDTIQAQAEEATGRKLTLAGPMDLSISLTPAITVEDVSFANASWGSREDMARMKRFELELSLVPLLSGEVRINRLILVEPDILLETDQSGAGNWDIGTGTETETQPADAGGEPVIPAIEVVRIENGALAYRDGQTGETTLVKLTVLEASADSLSSPLRLSAEGSAQGAPFKIDGEFGALASVVGDGGGAFPVNLTAEAAGLVLEATGSIADVQQADGVNLDVKASAESTEQIVKLAKLDVPAIGPVSFNGKVTKTGEILNVENLQLTASAGGANIAAEGAVADALGALNAALRLTVDGETLKTLSDLAGQDLPDIGPYKVTANVKKEGESVNVTDLDVSAQGGGADIAAQGAVLDALSAQIADVRVTVKGESLKSLGAVAGQDLPDIGPFSVAAAIHKEGESLDVRDLEASAQGQGATVRASGSVADALRSQQASIDFSLEAQNLADLGSLAGQDLPPIGPLSASGKLDRQGDVITVSGLKAKIAESDLGGQVTVNMGGERPAIGGTLSSSVFNLADVAPPSADGGGSSDSESPYVFSEEPLPLEDLKAADADISLSVGSFVLDETMRFQDVNLKLVLQGGNLALTPLTTRFADGAIAANVRLDGGKATPTLAADLAVDRIDYGKFLREQGISNDVGGTLDVDVNVTGAGSSLRQIASSLSGRTSIVGHEGTISNRLLSIISAGLADVYGPLLAGDKDVRMNCLVSELEIQGGQANSKALVIDTSTFTVAGGGAINLKNEGLDMYVDVSTKTASIASLAVPVNIGGTLKSPSFVPDPLATASAAAQAIGGLANISDVGVIGGLLANNQAAATEQPVAENSCVQAAVAPEATVTPEGAVTGALQGLLGGEGGVAGAALGLLGGAGEGNLGSALEGVLGGGTEGGTALGLGGAAGGLLGGAALDSVLGGGIEGGTGSSITGGTTEGVAGLGGALQGLLGGTTEGTGSVGDAVGGLLGGGQQDTGGGLGGAAEGLLGDGQQQETGGGLGGALDNLLGTQQPDTGGLEPATIEPLAPAPEATVEPATIEPLAPAPEATVEPVETAAPTAESAVEEPQAQTAEPATPEEQPQEKTPEQLLEEGVGNTLKGLFGD